MGLEVTAGALLATDNRANSVQNRPKNPPVENSARYEYTPTRLQL
jgi:hypothetical protein